jgi:hypothetical protein
MLVLIEPSSQNRSIELPGPKCFGQTRDSTGSGWSQFRAPPQGVLGSTPASAWAAAMTWACPSTLGAVKLTLPLPSLGAALDHSIYRISVNCLT